MRRTLPALSAAAVATELATPGLPPEVGTFVELEVAPDPEAAADPADDEVDGTLMLLDGGECDDVSAVLGLAPLGELS